MSALLIISYAKRFSYTRSVQLVRIPAKNRLMPRHIASSVRAHPRMLKFFRETISSLPNELSVFGGLIHSPDGDKLAAMIACHCGLLEEGEKALKPLKEFGPPIMDGIGPMSYSQLNGMLDAGYPKGALNYWESSFLRELSDDAIDRMVECFSSCPTPMGQMLLEHFHGAGTRVGVSDTAFPHRTDGYNFLALSQWLQSDDTKRCTSWARESYGLMQPFAGPGRYVNYLGDDETANSAYGPNYKRLQEIKSKYDPDNFFHMNQNIKPL